MKVVQWTFFVKQLYYCHSVKYFINNIYYMIYICVFNLMIWMCIFKCSVKKITACWNILITITQCHLILKYQNFLIITRPCINLFIYIRYYEIINKMLSNIIIGYVLLMNCNYFVNITNVELYFKLYEFVKRWCITVWLGSTNREFSINSALCLLEVLCCLYWYNLSQIDHSTL